jgi:hypothetical protein
MNTSQERIDAVISWVDGSDPVHRRKRKQTEHSDRLAVAEPLTTGTDRTRFIDNGELRYTIYSIRKFAPWIHTIFLITDEQVPAFFTREELHRLGVVIVDHSVVFEGFEWALPTFNSRSIETMVWRIPGLSERFIYFNDDFILVDDVRNEDFFVEDKMVVRGVWSPVVTYGVFRVWFNNVMNWAARRFLGITRSMHYLLQINSALAAGFTDRYFRVPHMPHPVFTSMLRDFAMEHPGTIEENVKYQFRDLVQFSGVFLAAHLAIRGERAMLKRVRRTMMINAEMDIRPLVNYKIRKVKRGDVQFLCVQGLEKMNSKSRDDLLSVLDERVMR